MSARNLHLSVSDGIAHIVIDRAQRRNAMSLEMWREMARLVPTAAADRSVLAIVLRGVDATAFASGADIEEMISIASDRGTRSFPHGCRSRRRAGVVRLAEAGDSHDKRILHRRWCRTGARLRSTVRRENSDLRRPACEARSRVQPIVDPTSHRTRRAGTRARSLILSARSFDASEAFRIGLVEHVFGENEIETKTMDYIEMLARRSQSSIRAAKQISAAAMAGGSDEDEEVRDLRGNAFSGDDLKEGLDAFTKKRAPAFGWR